MHSLLLCLGNKAVLSWMQGVSTACLDAQYSNPSVATKHWDLFFLFPEPYQHFSSFASDRLGSVLEQQCDHRYAIWHLTSVVVCQKDGDRRVALDSATDTVSLPFLFHFVPQRLMCTETSREMRTSENLIPKFHCIVNLQTEQITELHCVYIIMLSFKNIIICHLYDIILA